VPVKAKSAGILCGLQAFLLHSGADKRLLEAFYHYGVPPKAGALFHGDPYGIVCIFSCAENRGMDAVKPASSNSPPDWHGICQG